MVIVFAIGCDLGSDLGGRLLMRMVGTGGDGKRRVRENPVRAIWFGWVVVVVVMCEGFDWGTRYRWEEHY